MSRTLMAEKEIPGPVGSNRVGSFYVGTAASSEFRNATSGQDHAPLRASKFRTLVESL